MKESTNVNKVKRQPLKIAVSFFLEAMDDGLHELKRIPDDIQGVPKKCNIAIFSLNLFQRSDYTFSHVFRNQNFKPVPSKHFKHTHSEY